ncbi:MAG: substrate binding domain-containing protein, partial [Myxococcota bacterium]
RFGRHLDPRLIARKLWSDRYSAAAAPEYLDTHGRPTELADLSDHDCILNFAEQWGRESSWPVLDGGTVAVRGRFVSGEVPLRLNAALQGLGIALLPEPITRHYCATGQLELVLAEHVGAVWTANLVFLEREFLPPQVRAFIDHTVAFYRDGMPFNPQVMPKLIERR